jgi:hypothetical protein
MNRSLTVLSAILFLFAAANSEGAVLVDFDTVPGGGALPNNSVLSNQYASVGVVFSGIEDGFAVVQPTATTEFSGEFGGPPVSGQVLENRDVVNSRADIIRFSFSPPASGIEFDFIPFGNLGAETRLQALDGGGGLLFDQLVGGPASTNVNFHYTGLSALSGVARLEFQQPHDDWVWGLDNLQFTSVPEPTTVALLLFAWVSLVRRRTR